jgi:hypothetical protein
MRKFSWNNNINVTSVGSVTTASNTGSWSFTVPYSSQLNPGSRTITSRAIDAAGNTSPFSAAVTITIDTTAPEIQSTIPANGASDVLVAISTIGTVISATFSEPRHCG